MFSKNQHRRQRTAHALLATESVLLDQQNPFVLTSGRRSPVYVDCRRLLSFPRYRRQLISDAVAVIRARERTRGEKFTAIAGGETAGIAFAAFVAMALNRRMIYVRKQAKTFGRSARIEGAMDKQENVLLVEDMATDGGSKVNFVEAIRTAGGRCDCCFVWFFYDLTRSRLVEAGIALDYLATWQDIFAIANWSPESVAAAQAFLQQEKEAGSSA